MMLSVSEICHLHKLTDDVVGLGNVSLAQTVSTFMGFLIAFKFMDTMTGIVGVVTPLYIM